MSSTNRQTAAALVLASALIHASWNLAARAVKGDTSVMVLGLCTVAPTLLFVGLMTQSATTNRQRDTLEGLRGGWHYVLITGVVHAIYLLLLSHAYKIGDLSVVYPIARGSSVVFVAVFSRLIIPDQDRMSSLGLIGVAVVVIGVGVMGLRDKTGQDDPSHKRQTPACCTQAPQMQAPQTQAESKFAIVPVCPVPDNTSCEVQLATIDPRSTSRSADDGGSRDGGSQPGADRENNSAPQYGPLVAIGFALMVGTCTAAYSINDAIGVTVVDPLLFQLGNCTIMACITIPYMLCAQERRSSMINAVKNRKRYVAGIGIGGAGTYLIVLYAFRMAEKAPFVVTLRQCSIVFAALLGKVVLGETLTKMKVASVVLITGGVALVQYADG